MKENVVLSLGISLGIQWVSFFMNIFGLFQSIPVKDFVLKEILGLETLVQAIELGFYSWYKNHIQTEIIDVTKFRYYDWFLTTPMMLFSTMGFYEYLKPTTTQPMRLLPFFQQNSTSIVFILFMNFLMLFFGYLQELGLISLVSSSVFGFGALFVSFFTIYKQFVEEAPKQFIFFFIFFVWSLYGIAAMFKNHWKNTSYNILDVFAKNFYGIYLSYFIYTLSQNTVGNVSP
jgi:bacteriorhodopsin